MFADMDKFEAQQKKETEDLDQQSGPYRLGGSTKRSAELQNIKNKVQKQLQADGIANSNGEMLRDEDITLDKDEEITPVLERKKQLREQNKKIVKILMN